jgi:hypothetical protein
MDVHPSLDDALDAVQRKYRGQLRRWFETAKTPQNLDLLAVLIGEPPDATDLGRVMVFLTHRDVPPWSWGSPEALLKWQVIGGAHQRYDLHPNPFAGLTGLSLLGG